MVIHLYALCWNEEKMLPYFFKHYDKIVDQYFIFDNDSTDNSLTILKSHPKVIVNRFEIQGESLVESARQQFNQFWKQSKDTADWVIVCEVDEHLYHSDLKYYLQECQLNGYTLVIPEGYQMVSDFFPNNDKPLCESVTYGVREYLMDKPQIFNPKEILEINFSPGRHSASPSGNVITPPNKDILLLHYKYLGFHYLNSRYSEQKERLGSVDIAKSWGHHYLWNERKKLQVFEDLKRAAVKVL